MSENPWSRIEELSRELYGNDAGGVVDGIRALEREFPASGSQRGRVSADDAFLITYGDLLTRDGELPLRTLDRFLRWYGSHLSTVHVLPFFPYSSDDGFSVIDYRRVRQDLGDWGDLEEIGQHVDLMIDAVFNHMSAQSEWFHGFLAGNPEFANIAITVDPGTDLSDVARPRTSPLLTPFETLDGAKHVWTTFGADQIDINYRDPATLLRMLRVLAEFTRRGVRFIRIDAATYMWKEIGTSCATLPQTHQLVQLLRAFLDVVSPETVLITETNVPHEQNISYLADGFDEAQLVYNFALPPLVLHSLLQGNARALSDWASGICLPSGTCFLNFLASHDGIGLRGVETILSSDERQAMVDHVKSQGGFVSYMSSDRGPVPYEMNINYFDAVSAQALTEEENIARFVCAHAIQMSLAGVPAIYLHSLIGSHSATDATKENPRTINREHLDADAVASELGEQESERAKVFRAIDGLLEARTSSPAFDPYGSQRILDVDDRLFVVEREAQGHRVLCVANVSGEAVALPNDIMPSRGKAIVGSDSSKIQPWGVCWWELESGLN